MQATSGPNPATFFSWLMDIIQLWARNPSPSTLFFEDGDGRVATISIRDGDVIHAEYEGATGADAFASIARWPRAQLRGRVAGADERVTIDQSLMSLFFDTVDLLEGDVFEPQLAAAE